MLTASRITELVETGDVVWPGELRGDALLLRLGEPLQALTTATAPDVVDLADQDSIDRLYNPACVRWESLELRPGQMVLCQVNHPLRLGTGQAGAIGTLSHLARVGLATHVTSPWVLPGWNGYLMLELLNLGPAVLRLHRGMPAARLLLFNTDGPVEPVGAHPFYGAKGHLGSRYADEFLPEKTTGGHDGM